MIQLGDVLRGTTLDFMWNTFSSVGASITRATNGTISVYKGNNTTQTTTGVTDTEDFDGLTGVHHCRIVTTDAFYVPHENYMVVLSAATIDGQTVNAAIAHFSIENRMQAGLIRRGVLAGGASSSATLDTGASATDDKYTGAVLINTTEREARQVADYTGSSKVAATDRPWIDAAANLDTFELYAGSLPATLDEVGNTTRDAVFARAFPSTYGSHTFDELVKLMAAALFGPSTGLDTATAHFKKLDNSGDAISATVDASGNRSSITRSP